MNTSDPIEPSLWWQRPKWRWLFLVLAFLLYGSYRSCVNVLWEVGNERPIDWTTTVGVEMWSWVIWIALAPLILSFAKRFPFEKPHRGRHLIFHVVMMFLISLIHVYLWKGTEIAFRQQVSFFLLIKEGLAPVLMFTGLLNNFYKYGVIVGLYYAFDYFRKYRQREQEANRLQVSAATLQRRLTQARLDALRMQMNPHFLFNALNTVAVFMEEDIARANHMLVRLSDLLRLTLKHGQVALVPLETEIDLVRHYLEIEQIRFEDRLQIQFDNQVPPGTAFVPPLLMQPLAENAVLHGIAEKIGDGCITVHCHLESNQILLEINDNGPGLNENRKPEAGIGLKNIRARLHELFGTEAELRMWSDELGTTAQIRMPLKPNLELASS